MLLCSGKVYYELLAARREQQRDTIALVRVEQLYPFPYADLGSVLAAYPNATQVWWVQEEPQNMGAWTFIEPRIRRLVPAGIDIRYVGREEAASPASGSFKLHQTEERELLNAALARGGPLRSFDDLFFDGDAKEAVAFALLGYLSIHGQPGNVVAATGAAGPRVLGAVTPA